MMGPSTSLVVPTAHNVGVRIRPMEGFGAEFEYLNPYLHSHSCDVTREPLASHLGFFHSQLNDFSSFRITVAIYP